MANDFRCARLGQASLVVAPRGLGKLRDPLAVGLREASTGRSTIVQTFLVPATRECFGKHLPALHVVNAEGLVGNEEHGDVAVGASAVLHGLAFGEPDETAGAKRALVRDERSC